MKTTTISLQPVRADDDGLLARFTLGQMCLLQRIIERLRGKIDAAVLAQTNAWLSVSERLPQEARKRLLVNPYFNQWLFQLVQGYKGGRRAQIEAWLREFPRFLLIAALQHDLWGETEVSVPLTKEKAIRFPAHPCYIQLPEQVVDASSASLRRQDGLLICIAGGQEFAFSTHDLLAGAKNGLICQKTTLPSMDIEVDSSDPWIISFLETQSEWDVSPAEIDPASLATLQESLALLGRAWPEMLAELQEYVHLIVPFRSETKGASTNTSWPGTIFLNTTLQSHAYNIERLVHESSHLRLNIVMNEETLHYHSWDDVVPSPFRKGPRPVSGLYHGAFVVTRSASALDKVFQLTGDAAYRQRIGLMINQVEQALETLNTQVRLSPAGQALLDEITHEIRMLEERYSREEFFSAVVDPYLEG